MKFRIEIDDLCSEPEIVIHCRELTDEVAKLQKAFSKANTSAQQLVLYKDDTEYFVPVGKVLFFETEGNAVNAHTAEHVYNTKLKLYEIEELYSQTFIRVSKSAIVNVSKIQAITRSISNSFVQFSGSIKQVYVSRMYYKPLRDRIEESRLR